jgi:hypothetical protein
MIEPGEPFGESHNTCMKISAVNVDSGLLLRHGVYNSRIGVSYARHVVVHVDVASPVSVVQIDAFASNNLKRRVIKKFRAGTQGKIPAAL